MSRVRRRDTGPEVDLRRALHRRGLRYRLDVSPLAGLRSRADVVFGAARVAVYVDGCFWHGCPIHGNLPKNNREWWLAKLRGNAERDARTVEQLTAAGWECVRVWEHDDPEEAATRIEQLVRERRASFPGISAPE